MGKLNYASYRQSEWPRIILKIILPVLVTFLGAGQLMAHPHVFIAGTLAPKVSPDGQYLVGTEVRWAFDQIYSSQMILDFDRDKNGKIDEAEKTVIYEEAFIHLAAIDYFLEIEPKSQTGTQKIRPGTADDFRASIDDGKMVYQFYVPFVGGTAKGIQLGGRKEFVIFLEDPEYFIAFDSLLKLGIPFRGVTISRKEIVVQNLQWGPYPVQAVSVRGM
ncbi:DUF1007 family protein [Candidatus Haliotispira prima]|uniref:DUF1007 family protein n=1 Tax=Candidatus Haliotispira prima TaxID=3034016 RepID=A0ABY8MGG3_9SPIO|nr:DUF1007 family protein [Candidatus Haliotispira prima]